MTDALDFDLGELRNAVFSLADIVHARDQLIHARKVLEAELASLERIGRWTMSRPWDEDEGRLDDAYLIHLDDFLGPFVYALHRKKPEPLSEGIYEMETVYVGMTTRLLPRIGQHLAEGTKFFHSFEAWACESKEHARELERRMIEAYLPEYNKKHTGRPYRKAA